jgi:hypothetical protein
MLISYDREFIFFHVAKTAGISMRDVLQPYAQEPQRFKIRRPAQTIRGEPNRMYEVWEALLLHAKARDAREELPSDLFTRFFKFAFVRNPWDWQVSMYQFILRKETYSKHETVKALSGFEEYLEWVIATPDPFPRGIPKQQSEMLVDSQNQLLVDFVGHYETLASDFQQVCDRLKIEGSLPHLNATSHHDYRSYYTDHTRRFVAEHFSADVELFGYTFDGSMTVGQV